MSPILPSLKSLEVFVVAGRLLSFGLAAEAMGLSASAVSRRIRALEVELDTTLFIRRSKSVELTVAGVQYLRNLTPAFSAIRAATEKLGQASKRLVVSTPQSFAFSWLIPRLPLFRDEHPDIIIDLEVSADITGRNADNFDVAIFLTRGSWPDRHAEVILPIKVFPVTGVELARNLKMPADLLNYPLIHIRQLPKAWDEWFHAAGVTYDKDNPKRLKDMHFNDVQLAYEAALRGLGIAVGADVVVEEYLLNGQLVAPFEKSVNSALSYYFICSKSRLRDPEVQKLLRWLKACIVCG